MEDNYLLNVDFLKKVNLENSFDYAFDSSEISEEMTLDCSHIQDFSEEISTSVCKGTF